MTKIYCDCGRYADTNTDIDRISLYKLRQPLIKHTPKGQRIIEEWFYTWVCPWCEKDIVLIKRYALNGINRKKALLPETLTGLDACEYLMRTQDSRVNKTNDILFKIQKYSKIIDLSYYKTISAETQRPRFVNETGFSGNKITSKIVIVESLN